MHKYNPSVTEACKVLKRVWNVRKTFLRLHVKNYNISALPLFKIKSTFLANIQQSVC